MIEQCSDGHSYLAGGKVCPWCEAMRLRVQLRHHIDQNEGLTVEVGRMRAELADAKQALDSQDIGAYTALMQNRDVLAAENDRLRAELAEARAQAIADRGFQSANAWLRAELAECKGKLLRVADVIRYHANSDGGLLADIDAALKEKP